MPPKVAAKPRSKPSVDHVTYQDMITDAIITLKERNGSSRVALKKYIKANYKNVVDGKLFDSLFNRALKSGVEKGLFAQPKGSSGGTKLAKKEPKPAAAKAVSKAADAKATDKKVVAKKSTATKKAPAKKAASAKADAVPKPKAVATKAASKPRRAPAKEAAPVTPEKAVSKVKTGRVTKAAQKPLARKVLPKKKPTAKKPLPKKSAA
ncbi:BgTH12-01688 [Blumeria graminis f. sp. triticale]|uniref:Histone H1 n=3 Tax=Blumeria graminis TaxID=34373 RepID=A0A061HGV0_BLUGR|nr:Histone H1 [Blumeria graminis f. sp. tritici 96224]CAD6501436.1 BgTH12-01688 [Blumeria graminis f. sp. triticale]VDB83930.1 Bgt-2772 [Blumeria graminis f. sp. tritici]